MSVPWNRKEVKVALAYLRLAADRLDWTGAKQLFGLPGSGIAKGTRDRLADAVDGGATALVAMRGADDLGVTGKALAGVRAIVDLADRISVGPGASPAEVMESALEASGYLVGLESDDRSEERLANLEVLSEAAAGFADVASLLDELDRQAEADEAIRPRTASLFQTMTLERITFEDAMQLLSLPRVVGVDPADGVEITVQNGRFGPYLRKGSDSRSLETEEQLLTIGLDGCLAVLAQPKRRGRAAVKPPLRELGVDPTSGRPIILKDGNWGPYVTDGEHNASLKRGDAVEELTDERAAELLAERRMKGPAKKRR
ncbi:MAG: hypothetical protein HOH21_03750 [Acidimicrobiaceae bacterium]|nr:hypothetical protein [Acidimicrobiaceae bacterium]